MTNHPRLSVVVASVSSLDLLAGCLNALRPQCQRHGAELIVARGQTESRAELEYRTAGCRIVATPVDANLPRVRGEGLSHASGEWVALTEDHCVADEGWLDELMAAVRTNIHVLGGSMGNARRVRATDCGAFFAEYGIYGGARPMAAPVFAAANVAYHRSVVNCVVDRCVAGEWEDAIHNRLRASGRGFLLVRTARVRQNQSHSLRAFCRNRFEHGRNYARKRSRELSRGRRLMHLAATPALPPLLAARIYRAVNANERHDFLRALPATLTFLGAWALGEAAGYAGHGVPQ